MKDKIKKILKTVTIYILVFIILISIYMVLLTITSLIPSSWMEEHVRESSDTLVKSGKENEVYDLKYKEESIFIFTDALMINTAYSIDSSNPIESFMLARKNYIPGQTKEVHIDNQYNLGANKKYIDEEGNLYQTKELYALMHGENIEDSYEYARYWHGYLAVLRPLLVLFNYDAIRVVLFIVTLICIIALMFLLYKKVNLTSAIIYGLGMLSISIWIVTKSINEILTFLIALISSSILLARGEKIKNVGIFFFVIGSITSFIDLLTTPIVTLGIPTITYFLLLQKKEEKITAKRYILELIKVVIPWALGYGITWASKWIITEICFNRPLISQVINQILFRSNGVLPNRVIRISSFSILEVNCNRISKPVIFALFGIIILYMIVVMIKNRKKNINMKENLRRCIPYAITFMMPIVWYVAIKQHSYTHSFMVYRALVVSVISVLIIISKLLEVEKED